MAGTGIRVPVQAREMIPAATRLSSVQSNFFFQRQSPALKASDDDH